MSGRLVRWRRELAVCGYRTGEQELLADPLAEIARQYGYAEGRGAEPVVNLELFFEDNDDPASIGCNPADHPST